MRTFPDERFKALYEAASEAGRAMSEDRTESIEMIRTVAGKAKSMKVQSGWLDWAIAVTRELEGDFEMALHHISLALDADPLNPGNLSSFSNIIDRVRKALCQASPYDVNVPRLYQLLQRHDEADMSCHMAMCRHLLAIGRLHEAHTLAEALTTAAPASCDAWRLRANIARAQGDELRASEFDAQAMIREGQPVAWGAVAHEGES